MTMVRQSPLAGALMMTFLAPAVRWPLAFSTSVNRPVASMTRSTPMAFQGSCAGSLALTTLMSGAVDHQDIVLGLVGARTSWN